MIKRQNIMISKIGNTVVTYTSVKNKELFDTTEN